MKAIMVALLLPALAHSEPEGIPIDEAYIMVCKNAEEVFFVRPTGIIYAMRGMNGAPNCMAAIDTGGRDRILCAAEDSPDLCYLAKPLSS